MKNLIVTVALAALVTACGAAPTDQPAPPPPAVKAAQAQAVAPTKQTALHFCLPWIVCPDNPPLPPGMGSCNGSSVYDSSGIATTAARIFSEYPPDSTGGWCTQGREMTAGANMPGSPYSYNDNASSVAIFPEAHIDLWEHAGGGGEHLGLNGSWALWPNVVDLHQLCTNDGKPCGWWADRASSFTVCWHSAAKNQVVNNTCVLP